MAQNWLSKAVPVEPVEKTEDKPQQPKWLSSATPVSESQPAWLQTATPVAEEPSTVSETVFGSKEDILPESKLEDIAKRYNVDKEFLRESAPFLLATVPQKGVTGVLGSAGKYAGGLLTEAVGFGFPQKLRIESEEDPNKRRALEELRDIGSRQRGLLGQVGTAVATPSVLGAVAKGGGKLAEFVKPLTETILGRLGTAGVAGATAGVGSSREGEEVEGAIQGAKYGAGIGAAAEAIGAGLARIQKKRLEATPEKIMEEAAKPPKLQQTDIEAGVAAERIATAETDEILSGVVIGTRKADTISDSEFRTLIKENPTTWKEIQEARIQEATKRTDVASEMSKLEAEANFIRKELAKRPPEQLDINDLDLEMTKTKNNINNTKRDILNVEEEIVDLRGQRAERIGYESDIPEIQRPIQRLDVNLETKAKQLENLKNKLNNLQEYAEMVRVNRIEGPSMNQETAALQDRLNKIEDQYRKLWDRGTEIPSALGTKKTARELFVERLAEKKKLEFATELNNDIPVTSLKDAQRIINEARQQGRDNLEELDSFLKYKYELMLDVQAARRARDKGTITVQNPRGAFENMVDRSQYMHKPLVRIDEVHNQNNAQLKAKWSRDRNIEHTYEEKLRPEREQISKLAEDSDLLLLMSNSDLFVAAIERGKTHTLSGPAQKLTRAISKYQNAVKEIANSAQKLGYRPTAIEAIGKYITRLTLDTPSLISKVDQTLRRSAEDVSKVLFRTVPDISKLTSDDLAKMTRAQTMPQSLTNLIEFVQWRSGNSKYMPGSGEELLAQVNSYIHGNAAKLSLDTSSRAAISRRGRIPDFIREKRIPQILDRYTKDLLSSVFQREAIEGLKANAKMLRAAGSIRDAELIETMITDSIGVRDITYSYFVKEAKIAATKATDRAKEKTNNPVIHAALDIVQESPQALNWASKVIYNSLLGSLKIAPAVRNVVGNFTKTISELNNAYGTSVFFRAFLDVVPNFKEYAKLSKEWGYQVDKYVASSQEDLRTGLFKSKLITVADTGVNLLSKIGMTFQQISETLNHSVVIAASKTMANDLAKSEPAALNALRNFPTRVQRDILAARSNPQVSSRIISDYLKEAVLLTYDTPSKAQFARTMGPILATFSTWPTAQLGEAVLDIQRLGKTKGIKKQLDRYLLTTLVAIQLDKYLDENYPQYTEARKLIIGSGFFTASPVDALMSWAKGETTSPPIVDIAAKTVVPLVKGEGLQVARGLDAAAHMYGPGMGFLDNFFNLWVGAITGIPNEGNTKSEKILQGIERVTK